MIPEQFLQRMAGELGAQYEDFLHSLERPRAVALRLNPLKEHLPKLPFLTDPVPWEPTGWYYDPESRPGRHIFHDMGIYYMQEASAMAPAALLDPQPGEWVCDLCAAPGGKATQLAGRMQGQGLLLSNEIHPQRAKILSRNMERMGIANALVTNETPKHLAERFPGQFDRVLVDAPCSGEGMFRKEEAAGADWSPELVAMCAARQKEILQSAARLLRPGGRLVYSTCTFSREENEQTVEAFLKEHEDFEPCPVSASWFEESGPGMYRLWPHKLLGEGHFAAVLRKKGEENGEHPRTLGEKPPKLWTEFAKSMEISLPFDNLFHFGATLYAAMGNLPALRGLKVLRPGLELGAEKPGRFEPAHALALWLQNAGVTHDMTEDETEKWMKGQLCPGRERGWCLMQTGGCSVGWGKGDGKQLKNHYPKGLRRADL